MAPRGRRLPRDGSLTARLTLSYFFLAVLYLAFMWVLYRVGLGFLPMVVIAGGLLLVQYYYSDRMVLAAMGAREVRPQDLPDVHAMVERLAAQVDLPKPRIALMRTDMPNAFATGRDPSHAVVCVTTGILNRLTDPELEAVLAHELTHVKNRDMTIITMASFFATVASFIVQWAFMFMPYGGMGGGGGRNRNNMGLVYLASILVWIISFFLIRAVSRYREYAADRGSAIITGAPSQLMSALQKISGVMGRIPTRDLRQVENMSALFIMPAVSRDSLLELFQTHPSLEHRLAALKRIEIEMNR